MHDLNSNADPAYVDTSSRSKHVQRVIDDSDLRVTAEEKQLFPNFHNVSLNQHHRLTGGQVPTMNILREVSYRLDFRGVDPVFLTEMTELTASELEYDWDYFSKGRKLDQKALLAYKQRADEIMREMEKDELWDTDLDEDDEEAKVELHDTSGKAKYRRTCEKLSIVPAKYFLNHLEDPQLRMRYHPLGPDGTRAIAKALKTNIKIESLDLTGNCIGRVGAEAIAKMVEENNYIHTLLLGDNAIGSDGVALLCRAVQNNSALKKLDLSCNGLSDQACVWISDLLENSRTLTYLNLSGNQIGNVGAEQLGNALERNDHLEILDLSWNQIRGYGAICVAKGLKENVRICSCDLSWNGFANDGGKAIADMLQENAYLKVLRLNGNRVGCPTVPAFCKAFQSNETLEHLELGDNPLNTADTLQLIAALSKAENSKLKKFTLDDIPVDFEFVKTVESIQRRRGDFQCEYGPELRVGNTPDDIHKEPVNVKSPLVLLKEHVLINDLRLITALQQVDSDKRQCVTVDQFAAVMEELKIPFKRSHLKDLQSRMDRYGNGTIYFGDFVPPNKPEKELDLSVQ